MNSHQKTQELHLILLHLSCVLNDKKEMSVAYTGFQLLTLGYLIESLRFLKKYEPFQTWREGRKSQLEIQHSSHIHFNDQALSGEST